MGMDAGRLKTVDGGRETVDGDYDVILCWIIEIKRSCNLRKYWLAANSLHPLCAIPHR